MLPSAMPHDIIDDELALLRRVTTELDRTTPPAPPSEASLVREIDQLREALREGAKLEDRPALEQQLERHEALLRQLRGAERAPAVDRASPYFAHLRLREGETERDVLLGKTTRLLAGAPIVDWRHAPVSKVFYRYREGEDYEEQIGGREATGLVVARRMVAIRDGALRRVDAPQGSFEADPQAPDGWRAIEMAPPRLAGGQGEALRVHETDGGRHRRLGTDASGGRRRADKHLPDIAALIDPAQFDLVARPSSGFVIIRGTAGSGKTTVALHRIAFLAYEDPALDSDGTLFVVFSAALRDYVSHVLPALRVRRAQVRTFHEWAGDAVRRLFPTLPRALGEYTPSEVQRVKLHPALPGLLAAQVARVAGAATAAQALDDWTSVLLDLPRLADALDGALGPDALGRAASALRRRHEELVAWQAGEPGADAALDSEDLALLLRAWQLRVGPIPGRDGRALRYRHVAIDEVQDFAPIEVQVLLACLDERRSLTLAGDTQQHIAAEGGFTSWASFLAGLGLAGAEVSTLEVSYRCTHEIATFALDVLGDLREDETPPRTVRSGPPVELFRFTDHGACVAHLADALAALATHEPLASVAVLAPSRTLADLYFQGLRTSEVPRLRQVTHQDFTFAPGVEVTEIEQVKGLEFDYVILLEVSTTEFRDAPGARRRLHVGATRAIHQLWLTSVATPSAIVRGVLDGAVPRAGEGRDGL